MSTTSSNMCSSFYNACILHHQICSVVEWVLIAQGSLTTSQSSRPLEIIEFDVKSRLWLRELGFANARNGHAKFLVYVSIELLIDTNSS